MRKEAQVRMTISFRDKEQQDLFLGYVKTQANIPSESTSASAWIIESVLKSGNLLADDSLTRFEIAPIYAGTRSLSESFDGQFCRLSAIPPTGDQVECVLEYLKFLYQLSLDWKLLIDLRSDDYLYFLSRFRSILMVLEYYQENDPSNFDLKMAVKSGQDMLELYEDGKIKTASHAIDFVLSNWDFVSDSTYTYRMLAGLMRCTYKWRDVALNSGGLIAEMLFSRDASEHRDAYVELLRKVYKDW